MTSTASSSFFFVDEERRMTGIVALQRAKTLMKMFVSYITLGYVEALNRPNDPTQPSKSIVSGYGDVIHQLIIRLPSAIGRRLSVQFRSD